MRVLSHDSFYGTLHLSRAMPGLTCSHRVADAPPETVEVHTHLDAHFVLVTSGQYLSSAHSARADGPVLIYNPPGTTHRDRFAKGRGSFFTLTVDDERLAGATEGPLHGDAIHLTNHRARGLARALLMECARWSSASALRTEALSLELIASASRRPDVLEQGAPSWLPRALECVADQCGRDMSVADIAREAQVHPTHLARVFRAFLGCTPGDYLRARRLERAGSLLLDTSLPIARIALDCGFADQPQLTRAFTRTFGMPPDAFRRRKATTAMLHFDKTMSAYRATLGR